MTAKAGKQANKLPKHGSESTYTNWGCRCTKCRKAHAITQRAARLRRTARLIEAAS